jgi:hypothetical protein
MRVTAEVEIHRDAIDRAQFRQRRKDAASLRILACEAINYDLSSLTLTYNARLFAVVTEFGWQSLWRRFLQFHNCWDYVLPSEEDMYLLLLFTAAALDRDMIDLR